MYNYSHFKGAFIVIYKVLDLNNRIPAKHSYKYVTIEHFHTCLNKTVAIIIHNSQSNDIFVPPKINI